MRCEKKYCYYEDMDACKSAEPDGCVACEYGKNVKFFESRALLKSFGDDLEDRCGENSPYIYQYRTLEDFWRILESDSLWATNVRFSNDHAEQNIGIEYFEGLLAKTQQEQDKAGQGEASKDTRGEKKASGILPGDCYILCFCMDRDKLSQWRGYSKESGVAIGFDLSNIRPFSILNREKDKNEHETYHVQLNDCRKVEYIPNSLKEEPFPDLADEPQRGLLLKESEKLIPYIKHAGFIEERELRLLFYNENGMFANAINYRLNNGLKVPFIKVYAGDAGLKESDVVVRMALGSTPCLSGECRAQIQEGIRGYGGKLVDCFTDRECAPSHCRGCTIRYRPTSGLEYLPGHSEHCAWRSDLPGAQHWVYRRAFGIYISQGKKQHEIYQAVKKAVEENAKEKKSCQPKIWCDGHLPIREIMVGPSRNQSEVIESIKHYCANIWWLNDVEVIGSRIPYRG